MAPKPRKGPYCEGAAAYFNPDAFIESWDLTTSLPKGQHDFQGSIVRSFRLKPTDIYSYHADTATVTLPQVQMVVNYGSQGGLHAWYGKDAEGKEDVPPPPQADIAAYTTIFHPSTTLPKGLLGLKANAKKDSLRAQISAHLSSQLVEPQSPLYLPPKTKSPPKNPYLDLWAWTCQTLSWAGPIPSTASIQHAHHILPILYHHFGCVVPTQAALSLIQQLAVPDPKKKDAAPKPIIEIGSGTGYWTYLLRRQYPNLKVTPVDDFTSLFRTLWVSDTVRADGPAYLETTLSGAPNSVLLLVYPSVSNDFTGKTLRAFKGDAVVVAATQNSNGFSAFKDETVDKWVERERKDWKLAAKLPLPSFAGKDEALFLFVRKDLEGFEG